MKKKQKEELRSKSVAELTRETDEREKEILRLKTEVKTGKIKDTSSLRRKRDELSVIKTMLVENSQKELN